jgi:D-alanyl-D-alanine carboxypeptidase
MQAPVRVAALARPATLTAGLRLAAVVSLLATLALVAARPFVDPPGARGMGPLPACRYDDILTSPRSYSSWATTQVDTILRVGKSYVPPDLVSVAQAGIAGTGKVRALVIDDLRAMAEAATLAGNPIGVRSAYRSYETQQTVFSQYVARDGYKVALTYSARPGHSEHQLGIGIDFRSDPPVSTLSQSWGATPAGAWMRRHAWEYGFLMSYPKGKMALTCYSYEPWHFRYVGRELAATIHATGLTTREYLWANFTTTVVPPPTAKPPATPKQSHVPTPKPSVAPTDAPAPTSPASSATPGASPSARPSASAAALTPAPASPPAPSGAPATGGPPLPSPAAGAGDDLMLVAAPVAAGGVAIGTIVLGAAILLRRRGRSGVGL